jgi:hypothetical protein
MNLFWESSMGPRLCALQLLAVTMLAPGLVLAGPTAAEKKNAAELGALARAGSPTLRQAITSTFDSKDLREGTAWAGRGPDFFFAVEARSKPELVVDGGPGQPLAGLAGTDLWYAAARIEGVGKLHSFHYLLNGNRFGGKLDVPAFTA